MMKPKLDEFFDVIVHTKKILVIQTHAGEHLDAMGSDAEESTSFGQFNLGLHVNDSAKNVLANRARLLAEINQYLNQSSIKAEVDNIYWLNQIHSNIAVKIPDTIQNHVKPPINVRAALPLAPPSADALITDKAKMGLAIMTADCVPIVLYDEVGSQIAAVHAGWQGLANGVIANTLQGLQQTHVQADGSKIQAWIGACISKSCYEVSVDVVDKLLSGCQNMGMDVAYVRAQIVGQHHNPNKVWLDLPTLAALQLQSYGVNVHSFANAATPQWAYACSYSNTRYYSYRRMTHWGGTKTGRMAMVAIKLD